MRKTVYCSTERFSYVGYSRLGNCITKMSTKAVSSAMSIGSKITIDMHS